ncbi:hypothetical protein [Paenibacillus lutrae]|uniref:Uncharacterized protein n=1 Tax=Paenibacillus lutrae TaxID=2078573 RepID=A0A7X3FLH6_9BACL|nr:hypothetical protein [Paenibacillus lutrae]MVP01921.1 hypothetical protein [Paenibacillus lutrae]
MDDELIKLSSYYGAKIRVEGHQGRKTVQDLYKKHLAGREKALLDSAALAAGLSSIFYGDRLDESLITPQMEEAFGLAFPAMSLDEAAGMGAEQLAGLVSAWKGKYFEVLVRDKLNEGEYVGDIHLEPGQTAELAESAVQPGWDLVITDDSGAVVEELSLKATESIGYVKEALERYPDIEVLVTDDVLADVDGTADRILGSGIYNGDIEQAVKAPMASLFDSASRDILEAVLPGLPFVLIAFGEGRHLITGKRSFQPVLPAILTRSAKTGTAMGAGFLTSLILPDVFGIIAGAGVRMAFSRAERAGSAIVFVDEKTELILPMAGKYA